MTRLRRLTALGLLLVLLVLPSMATAATHETHGWWWRAQTGVLGADLPPPPNVPEDGLLVERAPDGATAVSAVRFRLADGEAEPVLTLTVASGQSSGAAIAACQTVRAGWNGAQAGRWDSAPNWDCEQGRVDGEVSDDGSTWSWSLEPLVREDGVISVMLVDATSTPFHVAFEAPSAASLTTSTAPPPPPPAPDPDPGPPPSSQAQAPPSSSGSSAFTPPVTTESGPAAPAEPPPPAPEVADPAPAVPVSEPPAQPVAAAPPMAPDEGLSPLATGLMGLIAGLLLTDLFSVRGGGTGWPPWRPPRESSGGVGRFARPRSDRPAALW